MKELGGLHVIGSERHEARRIDNQLRGRAARQGDPGSSRFYLSLQDDLMRMFGGQQVETMMMRMGMDDAMPLEHGLVGRIIEQSQTRVEGANFDARKHLLEYDDVLNTQRAKIYAQRDRIMSKEDLTEDVLEMLETEVRERVPLALEDEDGPWKLLAWLEQIQPSLIINRTLLPSFTYQLLISQMKEQLSENPARAQAALLEVASQSIDSEEKHLLHSVETLLEASESHLTELADQRLEVLDTFMEELELADETDTRSPSEIFNELIGVMGVPIKMSNAEQRLFRDDADAAADLVQERVEQNLKLQSITRLIGAVERRLDSNLDLKAADLASADWETVWEKVLGAIQAEFSRRRGRLIGESGDGQIAKDIEQQLAAANGKPNEAHLLNALITIPQGTSTTFDKKTHKKVAKRTNRLSYLYYTAQSLEEIPAEEVTERTLAHLSNTAKAMRSVWGMGIWESIKVLSVKDLNEPTRKAVEAGVEADALQALDGKSLDALPDEKKQSAVDSLGSRALSESYRQLLLRVISELWVDYLTRMEALRVSVRLEAYAQRDPLVEYKAQAFQMFQQLFADMRSSLVNRMFTLQTGTPKPQAAAPNALEAPSTNGAGEEEPEQVEAAPKAKRRRRRRRRKRK